ncbi:hypothetical protein SE91_26250 [Bradyrhizobium sp. DOA1]|nr:hypothetical protein SE91_26250 [Bradyrhizobium sp. DOA1]
MRVLTTDLQTQIRCAPYDPDPVTQLFQLSGFGAAPAKHSNHVAGFGDQCAGDSDDSLLAS